MRSVGHLEFAISTSRPVIKQRALSNPLYVKRVGLDLNRFRAFPILVFSRFSCGDNDPRKGLPVSLAYQRPRINALLCAFSEHDDLVAAIWIRLRNGQNSVGKAFRTFEMPQGDSRTCFPVGTFQPKFSVIFVNVRKLFRFSFAGPYH